MKVKSQKFKVKNFNRGFTLIETLIAVFLFMTIVLGVYQGFSSTIKVIVASRQKTDAMLLANEQLEVIRNMPYDDIGIVAGIPAGKIEKERTFVRGGTTYKVTASINNVDDPFDGTVGSTTNDLAPADYKKVSLDISCEACHNFSTYRITTTVAPKNLENMTGNGAIFVKVFDANGVPIQGANVHIANNQQMPAISINETTGNDGMYRLVDVPPGNFSYEVTATKSGYSASRTYLPGDAGNPNPLAPHGTVAASQVTPMSFAIDKLSTINLRTMKNDCSPVGGVNVHLRGSKLIGSSPDIYKYDRDLVTDGSGRLQLNNMEWDTYTVSVPSGSSNLLAGTLPLSPIAIAPGSSQDVSLVMGESLPNNVLIIVKDAATGLPLADSTVSITVGSDVYPIATNRGYFNQTDWSGGSGQSDFFNKNQFDSTDGNLDYTSVPGDIKLRSSLGQYLSSGSLISSVFDTGSEGSTFYNITWTPGDQPPGAGAGSVRFQIATSKDNGTSTDWVFKGPDGSESSYYTNADTNIWSGHNDDRYIRYKLLLSTDDNAYTPNVSDVSITYSSACMAFGQAFFNNLPSGTYRLEVSHAGYQTFSGNISATSTWQTQEVLMTQ